MPDEQKVEGTTTGATPGVDVDALVEKMNAKMKENMAAFVRQPEPIVEPQRGGPEPIADPLGDMIRGAVEPTVRAVGLRAEAAEDKADFYSDPDNGEALEHRKEIEETFNKLFRAGRPQPRGDIWNYIKGRDLDKFVEKRETKRKKQLEDAAAAGTVGDTAGRRDIGRSGKDPHEMDDTELDKAVAGVSF